MNFKEWKDYFQSNQNHFSKMNWTESDKLNEDEKKIIQKSLQQFQRGENSEGKSLFKYAKEMDDYDYTGAIKLFIKEEQTHAMILGKFMEQNHISRIKNHWVDTVFRKLRVLASLENSITVLVTAEIIAAIYYKALRDATDSVNLKSICHQILLDEEMHINFQSYALQKFYNKKGRLGKWISHVKHNVLMRGTVFIVWYYHKKVFRAGGYSLYRFHTEVMQEFRRCRKMIIGKNEIHAKKINEVSIAFH